MPRDHACWDYSSIRTQVKKQTKDHVRKQTNSSLWSLALSLSLLIVIYVSGVFTSRATKTEIAGS